MQGQAEAGCSQKQHCLLLNRLRPQPSCRLALLCMYAMNLLLTCTILASVTCIALHTIHACTAVLNCHALSVLHAKPGNFRFLFLLLFVVQISVFASCVLNIPKQQNVFIGTDQRRRGVAEIPGSTPRNASSHACVA